MNRLLSVQTKEKHSKECKKEKIEKDRELISHAHMPNEYAVPFQTPRSDNAIFIRACIRLLPAILFMLPFRPSSNLFNYPQISLPSIVRPSREETTTTFVVFPLLSFTMSRIIPDRVSIDGFRLRWNNSSIKMYKEASCCRVLCLSVPVGRAD